MKTPELSLVIPFYNEEGNVRGVLEEIQQEFARSKISYELIAVNNGSRDRTPEIIDSFKSSSIRKVNIPHNIGYGYGILAGLAAARGRYVGYGWGDAQISAQDFARIFLDLKNRNADLCKATRLNRESAFRRVQSFVYNRLLFLLFFVKSDDANGCPKFMKREVYEVLNLQARDWFVDPEVMIKARQRGYKIEEIQVAVANRKKGESKVNFKTIFEFLNNLLKYKLCLRKTT